MKYPSHQSKSSRNQHLRSMRTELPRGEDALNWTSSKSQRCQEWSSTGVKYCMQSYVGDTPVRKQHALIEHCYYLEGKYRHDIDEKPCFDVCACNPLWICHPHSCIILEWSDEAEANVHKKDLDALCSSSPAWRCSLLHNRYPARWAGTSRSHQIYEPCHKPCGRPDLVI